VKDIIEIFSRLQVSDLLIILGLSVLYALILGWSMYKHKRNKENQ